MLCGLEAVIEQQRIVLVRVRALFTSRLGAAAEPDEGDGCWPQLLLRHLDQADGDAVGDAGDCLADVLCGGAGVGQLQLQLGQALAGLDQVLQVLCLAHIVGDEAGAGVLLLGPDRCR